MNAIAYSINVYASLRERLAKAEPNLDSETLADTIEGITDLDEVIASVVRAALVEEAMADGLKGLIQSFQEIVPHVMV